ncbi:type VI secretion system protein TssL [Labrys sp. KNU-23]|uniref:type VI secretion system protein TssL, long form n=1 Tax=Labrys sp. KNU-23 TaxID=2789216 RepID=UPI0011EBC0CB|nr:type VI secretion system protein TssL, long form [Labrys sp. KNU-23]QEN90066.1 type VI secretion system protein TssL [Labrys sp. KNU-23]
MNKATTAPWQSLPTVVELTEDGARKQQTARKMAEMLDDAPQDGAVPAEPLRSGGWSADTLVRNFRFGGEEVPTIVASAAPLLNLAHALRHTADQPDIEQLRRTTTEAINRYERDLAGARVSPERARAAHYVVCATVDDVVLSKPWGVRAGWARSGLVSTYHMDVTGGDKVFDLLDHFHQSPGANKDLLLLIYLCLSLAFEGRTRVSPRGALELSRIRDSLYKTLLGQYGTFERELSPHWRGVAARHRPLRTAAALWTLLSILALLFGLGYLFFSLSLDRASDGTFARLGDLPPNEAPSIYIEPPPKVIVAQNETKPPPKNEGPVEPIGVTRLTGFMNFLKPEVDDKLVTLWNDNGRVLVRINNAGLFDTGRADVKPGFQDVISRIGIALATAQFKAKVVGYTDNRPIYGSRGYGNNQALSEARAQAVGDILKTYVRGDGAVAVEGRGDADPVASNDTKDGQAQNRRTEILVIGKPEDGYTGSPLVLSLPPVNRSAPLPGGVTP